MAGINMAQARQRYGGGVGHGLNASNERRETQRVQSGLRQQYVNADYLNQIKQYMMGQFGGGGGGGSYSFGGGGGGYSRGGGGGGGFRSGPSAYEQWQLAEAKRKQAELDRRKMELIGQLVAARNQANPLLDKYAAQYGRDINNVYGQNRGLVGGYNNQLAALTRQMNSGINNQASMLRRDMAGQGAVGPEMQAMLAANQQAQQGNRFLQQNAQGYNTRLAQMMAAAQADAQATGAAVKASSKGQLQNSYARLLAQIGMIGLQ